MKKTKFNIDWINVAAFNTSLGTCCWMPIYCLGSSDVRARDSKYGR